MDKFFDIRIFGQVTMEDYVITAENVENAIAGAIRDFRMFYKEDPISIQLSQRDEAELIERADSRREAERLGLVD